MERTSSSATANSGPPTSLVECSIAEAVSHFPGVAGCLSAAAALTNAGNALAGFSATPAPEPCEKLCSPLEPDAAPEPELDRELGSQRFPPGRPPPPKPEPVPLPPTPPPGTPLPPPNPGPLP